MTHLLHKSNAAVLRGMILDCLRDGLERTAEISTRTGVGSNRISARLNYLRKLGLINSTPTVDQRGAPINLWRLAGEDGEATAPRRRRMNFDTPLVVVSKTYPAVGKRDPLVSALFGAPVCTACGAEQGAQHEAGCIVPMVAA